MLFILSYWLFYYNYFVCMMALRKLSYFVVHVHNDNKVDFEFNLHGSFSQTFSANHNCVSRSAWATWPPLLTQNPAHSWVVTGCHQSPVITKMFKTNALNSNYTTTKVTVDLCFVLGCSSSIVPIIALQVSPCVLKSCSSMTSSYWIVGTLSCS